MDQPADLFLCRASISLLTLSDEAQHSQSVSREVDGLGRIGEAVHRGSIGQQGADVANDAQRHRPCAVFRASFAEIDQRLAVQIGYPNFAKLLL